MSMNNGGFEWDDRKAAGNFARHGVGFAAARDVFKDPFAIEQFDDREDYGEDRFIIIDGVDGPTSTASKCQGVGAGGATMKETVHERVYQNRRRSGQAVYSDSCAGEQGRARGEAQVAAARNFSNFSPMSRLAS